MLDLILKGMDIFAGAYFSNEKIPGGSSRLKELLDDRLRIVVSQEVDSIPDQSFDLKCTDKFLEKQNQEPESLPHLIFGLLP